jgi:hypothetical protein
MRLPSLALVVLALAGVGCKAEAKLEAAPAEPAAQTYGFSFAFVPDERLDHCAVYYATAKPKAVDFLRAQALRMFELTVDPMTNAEPLPLAKGCDEQFADRPVLAGCVMRSPNEVGLTFGISYYDIRTIDGSDAAMNACLSMGADWRPNPDPAVIALARFQGAVQKFERLANAQARRAR